MTDAVTAAKFLGGQNFTSCDALNGTATGTATGSASGSATRSATGSATAAQFTGAAVLGKAVSGVVGVVAVAAAALL